ncbi:hypothetical protein K505DRAFT_116897 [Melanomma pulvis-pyrius CBS 109.77]|uniref:Uncharacterized protein n=1 Tax=Melanomma pulvis-pyrius CBS 109.77 TaxID=1314802 RepID=A0A6A6WVF1_9PLEO|nr:hypothetical protein K505DRAFT_116897 [Melanomma pulvis-pyrius CBS 109.77]
MPNTSPRGMRVSQVDLRRKIFFPCAANGNNQGLQFMESNDEGRGVSQHAGRATSLSFSQTIVDFSPDVIREDSSLKGTASSPIIQPSTRSPTPHRGGEQTGQPVSQTATMAKDSLTTLSCVRGRQYQHCCLQSRNSEPSLECLRIPHSCLRSSLALPVRAG